MRTYRQLKRNKMYHCLKEIGERLDENDIKENNPNWNGKYNSGWLIKTYWHDIWYLFDLYEWIKQKKYTL